MAKHFKPKRCGHCGHTFKPRRSHQRFCKEKCRNTYHNKERAELVKEARANRSGNTEIDAFMGAVED